MELWQLQPQVEFFVRGPNLEASAFVVIETSEENIWGFLTALFLS